MKTITSVSGGKSSAYIAANYESDHLLFALVRTDDKKCAFKDRKIAKLVEDRIQKSFIGTLEEDTIIYTILDLEQYLGKEIDWVSGITYDEVVAKKGGWLPNKLHRYCTTWLKIDPMFYWWAEHIGEPVYMNIGFRADEGKRVKRHQSKTNKNGFLEYEATFEKHATGRHKGNNKWETIAWQKPQFPMFNFQVYKDEVYNFWQGKTVRFAEHNNCVGCFHRNPLLLSYKAQKFPNKMEWFASQEEKPKKGKWRSDVTYRQIMSSGIQSSLLASDFTDCDSGYCNL